MIENIDARDVDVLIAIFLLQVREFLFLSCVKKTISMKILVLRVINSPRHVIEVALYGVVFTSCLCQKPSLALARTSLARVFTQTTRGYNPVRRT